jgi:hypothetical protein
MTFDNISCYVNGHGMTLLTLGTIMLHFNVNQPPLQNN